MLVMVIMPGGIAGWYIWYIGDSSSWGNRLSYCRRRGRTSITEDPVVGRTSHLAVNDHRVRINIALATDLWVLGAKWLGAIKVTTVS